MSWLRSVVTKNLSKSVEAVVEPAKETVKATVEAVKQTAGNKVDLYSKVVVLAVEALVGYLLLSEIHKDKDHAEESKGAVPGTIIINNYISTGKKEENGYESD